MSGSQWEMWNRLAFVYDRDREIACRAYLDLIAGRRSENVDVALQLGLGSAMLIEVPHILKLIGDVQGKRVLDAGCGGGFYSIWLGEKGARVLGVDTSEVMLEIARGKALAKKLDCEFRRGDVSDLDLDESTFDLVLSTLVLMNVKELDRAVGELFRVTRKGGHIIISLQHPLLTAGDWERESGRKLFRKADDYFRERERTEIWEDEQNEKVSLIGYHRSLQAYTKLFLDKGCVLFSLVEPYPHEAYKTLNPREYEDTRRIPHFVILKFEKIGVFTQDCGRSFSQRTVRERKGSVQTLLNHFHRIDQHL